MEENRYILTMIVAKRAMQLIAGAKPLVKIGSKNPVDIALRVRVYDRKSNFRKAS